MSRHVSVLLLAFPLLALSAACEHSQSSTPLSPSIAGPMAGVEVETPKLAEPKPGSQIAVEQQPITFIFDNSVTNGPRPVAYIFEIGTDASFSTKVYTQNNVEAGAKGNTTVTLPQSLTPERTYYWRVKADDGANTSEYSTPISFRVYTPVIIQAPTLREPAEGQQNVSRKPTFSINNSQKSGPAGAIQYLFEVASDAAFADKVASSLVNENSSGQTSYTIPDDLSYSTVYYWRVKATDPGHDSPRSQTRVFTTLAAPVIAPAPGLPGLPSPNDAINPNAATFYNNPSGIGSWPQTATITSVEFNGAGMIVEFDRRTGPHKWPELTSPDGFGPLQYTLGLCYNIGGSWHCSAAIQFWDGRPLSESGPWQQIHENWYYSEARWGPMTGYRPARGELVMVFAGQGNLRGGGGGTLKERTNFAPVRWAETYTK
jgi:hypothetical protein